MVVRGFGDDHGGDDQAISGLLERRTTAHVIGVVLVDNGIERPSVNDGEHVPILR